MSKEFIESYIEECLREGNTEEEVRKKLNVVYSFLAKGLFGFYKATKKKDIKVSLSDLADVVDEIAEGMKE
ncbi:hypothetical protein [Leptospira santarosai]|uniref:hypothetical protein n=1 Tax=Leptospira santarosai TaxID=28183 RepID=UPI0024AF2E12|nr:hypothetical protein [Leptospira santarosai]MDI7215736.1 hypothetical protein [Leptospira santarosai]